MQDYFADEIGVLSPNQLQVDELYAGEVIIPLPCFLQFQYLHIGVFWSFNKKNIYF